MPTPMSTSARPQSPEGSAQKKAIQHPGAENTEADLDAQSDTLFEIMRKRFGLLESEAVTVEQIVQFTSELAIYGLTQAKVQRIVQIINRENKLNRAEFRLFLHIVKCADLDNEASIAFYKQDQGKRKRISKEQFKQCITDLGIQISDDDVNVVFQNEESMDYQHFLSMFELHPEE